MTKFPKKEKNLPPNKFLPIQIRLRDLYKDKLPTQRTFPRDANF